MTISKVNGTFSYSGPTKVLFLVCLIFFGGGFIGSIAVLLVMPQIFKRLGLFWVFAIIGYYYFAKVCLTAWRERNNFVTVDDRGIALNSRLSQIQYLNWEDIINVKIHRIKRRVTITDKYNKSMRLEFELDEFSDLLNVMIDNIPQLDTTSASLRKLSASLQR